MNPIDQEVAQRLKEKGFTVTSNGWPDLLAESPEGDLLFIEVKSNGDTLRGNQQEVLQRLADHGLDVFVVRPRIKSKEPWNFNWKPVPPFPSESFSLDATLKKIEFDIITQALELHLGNKDKAADFLGITPRQLRYKIESLKTM